MCLNAPIVSAVRRTALATPQPTGSVQSTNVKAARRCAGQRTARSTHRTSTFADCAIATSCATPCVPAAALCQPACSTTSHHTGATPRCSGISATGKDCASVVTASRPHASRAGRAASNRTTISPKKNGSSFSGGAAFIGGCITPAGLSAAARHAPRAASQRAVAVRRARLRSATPPRACQRKRGPRGEELSIQAGVGGSKTSPRPLE